MVNHVPRGPDFQLELPPALVEVLRADLPRVAEQVVETVISEVPSYSEPFRGQMGRNIENAVGVALAGFLDLTSAATSDQPTDRLEGVERVFAAAYALGRGEARSGRSMDALTAAYRVGARRSWHLMSQTAVDHGLEARTLARFAGLVFDYIDELSSVSIAGHADELAREGRLRERHLAALAQALVSGRPAEELERLAEQSGWRAPATLAAVVLPQAGASSVRSRLDARTLELGGDVSALDPWPDHAVLLVPGGARAGLLRALGSAEAAVGPARPWTEAGDSFGRALRALELGLPAGGPLDTDAHLAELVVRADPAALADLRDRVLAPLAGLRPATRDKLADTLRAWLLHQGRREQVADALFVHPQTVRYRLGQLREAYGDRLDDPDFVRDATVALS